MNFCEGVPIYLNVYVIQTNTVIDRMVGIYHTGVQVGDKEYAFGRREDICGVWEQIPKTESDRTKFKESIFMGYCTKSQLHIDNIIEMFKMGQASNEYQLFCNNCNNFSNSLIKELIDKSIPAYINFPAKLASVFFRGSTEKFEALGVPHGDQQQILQPQVQQSPIQPARPASKPRMRAVSAQPQHKLKTASKRGKVSKSDSKHRVSKKKSRV
ncbi:MAG: hypothetical protein EZS28_026074 [Streblomastix strix]|uniref:PPPDE domain-containing protein n=1 Tax=Streblomastix strix TaxID=222440 RepID=A0A5J4V7M7_9EUKA|nr:MAG: hypothetical protein EZS28_026074 [Streblomastix strix]